MRMRNSVLRLGMTLALSVMFVGSLVTSGGCAYNSATGNAGGSGETANATQDHLTVELEITGQKNESLFQGSLELSQGATVLDALLATNLVVVATGSGETAYVTTINGLAADAANGWVYTVNTKQAMDSLGVHQLAQGDKVWVGYVSYDEFFK